MADNAKTTKAPKPSTEHTEESELNKASIAAAKLEAMLSSITNIPGVGLTTGVINRALIQKKFSNIPHERIKAGEGPNFQTQFDEFYSNDKFPPITSPTKTGLYVIESSPKQTTSPFSHGHAVAAYSNATSKAIGGTPVEAKLRVRMPFEGQLTNSVKKVTITPQGINSESMKDFAAPLLMAEYYSNSANVISVSLAENNPSMSSAKDRLKATKDITAYYGPHTVFALAAGNEETQEKAAFAQNGLRTHPNALLIGAANSWDTLNADGNPSHSYSLANYSAPGADVIMTATPPDARYAERTEYGIRHIPHRGTSLATPQAAATIAHLLQRFVKSPENPQATLSPQDVLLAIKNTAQPIHTLTKDSVAYDLKIDPPTESRSSRETTALTVYKIGQNYTSLEAGNGIFQPKAAWALLEQQEQAVREGKEKTIPRKNIIATTTPKTHKLESTASIRNLPKAFPTQLYIYNIDVPENMIADQIVLDMQSKSLGQKTASLPLNSRPRVFLQNPDRGIVEVRQGTGNSLYPDGVQSNPYVIARVAGMQGSAMKGKWTVLSSEPLNDIKINFDHAMSPEHVAARILPDAKEREKNLYRHTDFSAYPPKILDELLKPNSFIYAYDLSETGFPPNYTEVKLAEIAASDKATAQKLLKARFTTHPNYENIATAVETGNSKNILSAIVPERERFEFIRSIAGTASKESLLFLIKNGFASEKEPNTKTPSTALIEVVKQRHRNVEPDLIKAFLTTFGPDAQKEAHIQDSMGRTALHYARNAEAQSTLMNIDLNDQIAMKSKSRMVDIKDNAGQKYGDVSWNDLMNLPQNKTPRYAVKNIAPDANKVSNAPIVPAQSNTVQKK